MSTDEFSAFYQRYYGLVLTVAEQRLRGSSDAEDVTSEVFRIAWKRCSDGDQLTLQWLYQVLRNVIGNEYRRRSRSDSFHERVGALLVTEMFEPANDDALDVRRAIEALSQDDQELIRMAYWEDLSGQEIAEILKSSAVAIRVRLLRARRRLKSALTIEESHRQEVRDG